MVPHSRTRVRLAAVIGALAFAAILGACTRMPLVAPSGTVITLISTTNVLPTNGSTDIIALLIENGTATSTTTTPGGGTTPAATTGSTGTAVHNGTVVDFSTTLGRVEPAEAKTNGGQVTVKLIADGRSGVATVTAYSGGATKTLTVNVGAAAASRILVTASPQSLPFPGGTSTINAIVQDQQGNPIFGVPVAFSTTKGALGMTQVLTDAFGNATTTLTTTADATVTASAGGGTSGTLTGTVGVTILPNGTISITAPTGTQTLGTPVVFTVGIGGVVVSNVVVDFGDGSQPTSLGPITGNQAVQHVYNRTGSFTASATATFVDGSAKTVTTTVVITDYVISASCGGNVAFGSTSTFTATVNPASLSISDYIWDFFDSDLSGASSHVVLHGSPQSYTWQSRGTKTVQLAVVPTFGGSKTTTCSLEVN
jgi:hypothetical protein